MNRNNEIVVTGMGLVSPLGNTVHSFWESLLKGDCAAKAWDDLKTAGFRSAIACRIDDDTIPDDETRGQVMAIKATEQALDQSKLPLTGNIGVYLGTTMGESFAFEQRAAGCNTSIENATGDIFAKRLKNHFSLTGPTVTLGTACAAGNYAIGLAARAIKKGKIEAAIVGGVDPFSRIAMVGFSRSRAMTSDICRPFDQDRKGMQLGEAAAFLILEKRINAEKRGITPLAKIGALGLSCDAYHPTKPIPEGTGMAESMKKALQLQQLSKKDIDWICAHGSGTRASDHAEANAIRETFGSSTRVSGIKGAVGHSLGAATALEAIACVQSLQGQIIPSTTNHKNISEDMGINIISNEPKATSINWVLNCGYAFGGLNASLLIGKAS